MISDKLKIILITYNREKELAHTLEQIFAENSPIKNFDITILNNNSTDGTDDLILQYQAQFSNLKHIRNQLNIGGNANICRAYEIAKLSGKEYGWIICDDDLYNFDNWKEVEQNIANKTDIICLSDYVFPNNKYKNNRAYQIFQLTFVPACIFKLSNIDEKVILNMYESTFSMFQQLSIIAKIINNHKLIHVLSKPIVFNGLHYQNKRINYSFIRGTNKFLVTERKEKTCWILGFANIISLLEDKKLQKECMDVSIPYIDIYASWRNFYRSLDRQYFNLRYFNYFYEIYKNLKFKRQIGFCIYKFFNIIPFIISIPSYLHSLIVLIMISLHNKRFIL